MSFYDEQPADAVGHSLGLSAGNVRVIRLAASTSCGAAGSATESCMSTATTHGVHPEWDTLVDYWLGDTDAAATEAIDEHLMHCDACGSTSTRWWRCRAA